MAGRVSTGQCLHTEPVSGSHIQHHQFAIQCKVHSGIVISIVAYNHLLALIIYSIFYTMYIQAVISFVHIRRVNLNIKLPREEADLNNITGPAIVVEMCDCPQGMVGSSCDECAVGYYRPSGNPADPCLPCQCNNQTQTCDQRTGVCTNCGSNTTGDHCQQCLPGFFGNITSGISCQPCQCPFLDKNFSPTCILDSDGNHTCDQCGTGYAGRRCDLCANGYFGNPLVSDKMMPSH